MLIVSTSWNGLC